MQCKREQTYNDLHVRTVIEPTEALLSTSKENVTHKITVSNRTVTDADFTIVSQLGSTGRLRYEVHGDQWSIERQTIGGSIRLTGVSSLPFNAKMINDPNGLPAPNGLIPISVKSTKHQRSGRDRLLGTMIHHLQC